MHIRTVGWSHSAWFSKVCAASTANRHQHCTSMQQVAAATRLYPVHLRVGIIAKTTPDLPPVCIADADGVVCIKAALHPDDAGGEQRLAAVRHRHQCAIVQPQCALDG